MSYISDNNLEYLNSNIIKFNKNIQVLKLRFNNQNREYEIEKNSIDDDYVKLFSYIKNIDNDPFDDGRNDGFNNFKFEL